MDTEPDDLGSLDRLREEYLEARQRGEAPSLDEIAAENPELADNLRAVLPMVELLEKAGGGPPVVEPGDLRELGELEDFDVVREIGRGGMGIVYEAVQESLGRRVALKLLPPHVGLDERQLQRFRREAQAAARLQHPHIVGVFGVGETGGQHFLAMQYVDGPSLARVIADLRRNRVASAVDEETNGDPRSLQIAESLYTDRRWKAERGDESSGSSRTDLGSSSSTTALLRSDATSGSSSQSTGGFYRNAARLGKHVAEALAYAHGEGVLHRDIKPSNLLLDAQADVFVADFGLAKLEEDEQITHTGDILGTPRYIAPEGLHGWSDARSDVYGLGVTLYELVTLEPAFEAASRHELLRRIEHDAPIRPRRHDATIPSDLETIILTAMEKEPARRYEGAGEMARDLERFLRGEPIHARRATLGYRAGLFLKRHPVGTSVAGVVLLLILSLVAGWIVSLKGALTTAETEREQALANYRTAADAVQRMLAGVGYSRLRDEPHFEAVRSELLKEAVAFYEELLDLRSDDLEVLERAARAYVNLSSIQNVHANFPERDGYLARADELIDRVEEQRSDGIAALRASVAMWRGRLRYQEGRFDEMEVSLRVALAYGEGTEAPTADSAEAVTLLFTLSDLASHLINIGREEAEGIADRGLELAERVLEARPTNHAAATETGKLLRVKGKALSARGEYEAACDCFERAQAIFRGRDSDDRFALAQNSAQLAITLRKMGEFEKAEEEQRRALDFARRLHADFPTVPLYAGEVAKELVELGTLLKRMGRLEEAAAALAEGRGVLEGLIERFPDYYLYVTALGQALNTLGNVQRGLEDYDAAEESLLGAIEAYEGVIRKYPPNENWRINLAIAYGNLGVLRRVQADDSRGAEAYRRAVDIVRDLLVDHPSYRVYERELARLEVNLAGALIDLGDLETATTVLLGAEGLNADLVRQSPRDVSMVRNLVTCRKRLIWLLFDTDGRGEDCRAAVARHVEELLPLATSESRWELVNLAGADLYRVVEPRRDRDPALSLDLLAGSAALHRSVLDASPGHGAASSGLAYTSLLTAEILVELDRKSEAVEQARTVRELVPEHAGLLTWAARVLASAVEPHTTEPLRTELLEILARVVELDGAKRAELRHDPAFEGLRDDDEFLELVAGG